MTTTPAEQSAEQSTVVGLATMTVGGEPTPELRALLSAAGWAIVPTQQLHDVQLIPGSELELGMATPLAAAAEARVGQRVTLMFVGSDLQTGLEGKLTELKDDGTIVLDDGEHRFDVALQAIAAIQGSRP